MAAAPDYLLHASRETSPELALVDATLAAELRQTLRVPSEIHVRPQLVVVEEAPVEPVLAEELMQEPAEHPVRLAVPDAPAPEHVIPDPSPADDLIVFPDAPAALVAPVSVEVDDSAPPPAAEHDSDEAEESDEAPILADDLIVEPTEHVTRPAVPDTAAQVVPAASAADELIIFPDAAPLAAPVSVEVDDSAPPPAAEHDSDEAEEPEEGQSKYPVLPALDARTTEETDAVLRRIREQIATDEPRTPPRRIRRSFVVASGLAAACAIAAVVTEIQLGFVQGL